LAGRDRLLAELTLQTRKTHSEQLMPHIQQILELAEVPKEKIEAVAVSIGPGSFTGLRIGLATAKALAYAWRVPLVGVPTMDALAYGCPVPGCLLASTLDAQKGNIYLAAYRYSGADLQQIIATKVIDINDAVAELTALGEPVVVLGEAAALYGGAIEQAPNLLVAKPHIVMPRAASIAGIGWKLLDAGVRHDVMELEPLYVRRSEAEELWEKRQGECL